MTRDRVKYGFGFVALALAVGLAGCGGDEAPPAPQPPAPAPAPPPFQPQPVEVTLGELGGTVTLMTKEGGGFTLDGEDFTGGDVSGENGMTYKLELADGTWAATHLPTEVPVELGTSGGVVTLAQNEDGSYAVLGSSGVLGVSLAPDGTLRGAQAENGSRYSLELVDGEWQAVFEAPAPIAVGLGTSGESVMVQMNEDGSYSIGDMALTDGTLVSALNGNTYELTMGADGSWGSSYSPTMQEVTLGITGETVTVTKAEDGSYWVGSDRLADGGTVSASNGNMYELAMGADGTWSASFAQMPGITVRLGTSGATIVVDQKEDGSYAIVGLSGVTASTIGPDGLPSSITAINGSSYVIVEVDGTLTAEFIAPDPTLVHLGSSGESVQLQRAEDGTYRIGHTVISSGAQVTASNGDLYMLTLEDGNWSAAYVGLETRVRLGESGDSIHIERAEDGSYLLDGRRMRSGMVVTADNGGEYRLTLDDRGNWTATFMPMLVTVALGSTGDSVTLVQAEDSSWWIGNRAVADGSTVRAGNGNVYTLMLDGNEWSATYRGDEIPIEGTGLSAKLLEDGSGYDVSGERLPASGNGNITIGDASFRVWSVDGVLMGARYQTEEWDADTAHYAGDLNDESLGIDFDFVADDEDTPQNEERTGIEINGQTYPYAELAGSGTSSSTGENFLEVAREGMVQVRAKAEALFTAFDDESTELEDNLAELWNDTGRDDDVVSILEDAFGKTVVDRSDPPDTDEMLETIDDIIEALSSVEGLEDANDEDGVFEGLLGDDISAEEVFDAVMSESTVTFGTTGAHSYGAVSSRGREDALDDLDYVAGEKGNILGAFAYSTMSETTRTSYVQTSGNAFYEGGTIAVDEDGVSYAGDITVRVRFANDTVDGLVTNLASAGGEPWSYNFGEADSITLPTAELDRNGRFSVIGTGNATVTFARLPGSPGPATVAGSTLDGRLVGDNETAPGEGVVGTWTIGGPDADTKESPGSQVAVLTGGFGAERVADRPDQRPAVDDDGIGAEVVVPDSMTAIDDGMLTITVDRYEWVLDDTDTLDDIKSSDYTNVADDKDTDEQEDKRTYQISLASLFRDQDVERNYNGERWVDLARDDIEKIRAKLAALLDTDQLPSSQRDLWEDFQNVVGTKLFDASDLDDSDLAEPYEDIGSDDAFEAMDDVLDALSNLGDLDDALDEDGGGVFTDDDGDPFDDRSPSDIWNERESEVKAWLGSTNYTRFGLWRVRRSRNALRTGGWDYAEDGEFAYSPLPAAAYASGDPSFPEGGSATYEGATLAWARPSGNNEQVALEGSVEVAVDWKSGLTGSLTAVIYDLVDAEGDRLVWKNSGYVDELIFPSVLVNVNSENELRFFESSIDVRVEFTNRGITPETATSAGVLDGKFVGRTADGPLGVVGLWELDHGSVFHSDDEGVSWTFEGSFGAELP